ncbi:MAG TPA: hypothetical protein PLE98_02830 [Candidatus Dojkabacteria bacterium]|nr:hypothetical protein [Candidatus Dojkabacteria bacterium]
MENKQDTDFLNNPDEFLSISNTEQLIDEFGDMFDQTMLYKVPIYLEKNQYGENTPEERFLATHTSLVTLRGQDIWDMDKNDQEFLEGVHKALTLIKVAIEREGTEFDRDIVVHGKNINVTYEPYTVDTSEYVIRELNERKELLQKKD